MAKAFFKEKGIEYQEFDVAADTVKRKEMIDLSGQMGVPVIDIDGQLMVGFSREKLEELLA
jgi:glutaredoxin